MTTNTVFLNSDNFESAITESKKPILVDFYADWCAPCRALAPKLDELSVKFSDKATIAKVNIDKHPDLAERFNVRSIPTLLIFNNGEVVNRLQGNQPSSQLETALNQYV